MSAAASLLYCEFLWCIRVRKLGEIIPGKENIYSCKCVMTRGFI